MTSVIPSAGAATYVAAMELLAELSREHELIARVAGSLRRFVGADAPSAEDARRYIIFFRQYGGVWHHEREEELLIPALANEAHLPSDRGPIVVLLADHARMADLLTTMEQSCAGTSFDAAAYRTAALDYSESLLAHIDMEESVFFPESEARLRRSGVRELASRTISDTEQLAAEIGQELSALYPPLNDLLRGDGCVMCPSFHISCSGIEREWWNEWEWEEMEEHVAAS